MAVRSLFGVAVIRRTVLGAALPCSGHAELHWVEVGLVVVVEEVAHLLGHR